MKQITKITVLSIALIFGGVFAHFASAQFVQNQDNRILIYDGGNHPRSFFGLSILPLSKDKESAEIKSARKQILAKSSQIKNAGLEMLKSYESAKTSVNCKKYENDRIFTDIAEGTFTKLNAKQTV